MTDVIYLAPLCQEHERMWCEHDAPVDCECIDGPHPWIKYIAALRQPTQSDAAEKDDKWIEEFIDVYVAPDDATHVADFLRSKCQPTQSDALPAVGTEGRYVYEGMVELSCVVTAHVEGWLEVKFTLDDGEAIVRPSRFHAALEQSK